VTIGPGTRIGPYEVEVLIGEGGMGKVYRSTDTNLKRPVAIKVLPESVATDAERVARFQREAEVLARLNHPNIAQIHGLERSGRTTALVMELVEGPTLADRIAQGKLATDEATAIAKEIAAALQAAHEQGVVHRDLKPANIKVRPDGTVKVLDFGLAKALEPAGTSPSSGTQSPTVTSPAMMTGVGVLLGTAAYMSPEQARGRVVDTRTDIWSFGAVLYEMLTGKRAFAGDEVSDVLASVLAREPDWTLLPADLPPVAAAFIKRCLHKDRRNRVSAIGDVALALEGAFDGAAHSAALPRPMHRPIAQRVLPLVATAIVTLILAGLVAWRAWPAPEPRPTTRFDFALPDGQLRLGTQRPVIAISADGRHFIYQTFEGVLVRSLDSLQPRLIAGITETTRGSPFLSPDGQSIGFFTASGLKKVSIDGGTPVLLCRASDAFGATWGRDGTILFGQRAGIMRVSADGGTPELIVRAGEGEELYGPQMLPGGRSVLFSVTRQQGYRRWDQGEIVVQSLSSNTRTVVVQGGGDGRYLASGHLVYAVGDALVGAVFDGTRLVGGAVSVLQGVQQSVGFAASGSNFAISDQGTLVYLAGYTSVRRPLLWVARDGTSEAVASIPAAAHEEVRLSPKGDRALVIREGDIWTYELAGGRSIRVTRDASSGFGVWDPTGLQVAHSSARGGSMQAWVSAADGSGQARQLTHLEGQVHVDNWSRDGTILTLHEHRDGQRTRILMLRMDRADAKPEVFFDEDSNAEGASFSPDGRHVAFLSAVTGQNEVYIRPYPGPGEQLTVSIGGGREPLWAPNGELFYRSLNGQRMFSASLMPGPNPKPSTPVELFKGAYYIPLTGSPRAQYDVTPDGKRFLMLPAGPSTDTGAERRIVIVQNWFEELKRLAPLK